ncbi:hypothetical protein [Sulfobacillus thermosulfidooxidans]|uniref:hypothetical protein n=1 Tax=Sulfobacillus thermosulfidooxidans TaxID=28034 RepID=UPI0006B62E66|nr:hypothetical protein [Sulfobacillus thermosulfidooxidans]
MINLWNPHAIGLSIGLILLTAVLLGMVHGITPDEHTWPITFSYAIGSYSSRGGMKAGFLFSLAFTFQRAIASELAFLALARFLFHGSWEYIVYSIVGIVMVGSGAYILKWNRHFHFFHFADHLPSPDSQDPRPIPMYMPLVHGFIAGWGTGAFALIVYTVLAPAMHHWYLAFLPGLFFGLGTMLMQILLGSMVGLWMEKRHLSEEDKSYVARKVSGRTLLYGGLAFIAAGFLGIAFPVIGSWQITTGIKVHNLDHLGIGFVLAVIVLFSVAWISFIKSLHEINKSKLPPSREVG